MLKRKELYLFIAIFAVCLSLFYPSFFKHQYLFPGNYMLAWFSPFKEYSTQTGTLSIAHKPVADDAFRHILPFKLLGTEMMIGGNPPLWNPYNGAGMPLLATLNSGFFDPLNILLVIFPVFEGWNVSLFLQFFLIAFFTYLYCRKLHLSHFGSFFASITFLFSGYVIARVSLGAYGIGIFALPCLLFLIESFIQSKIKKILFLIPPVIFLLNVSTHPQIAFYILLFCFCYFLLRVYFEKEHYKVKKENIILCIIFFICGVTLSAIQLIPTAELLRYSNINNLGARSFSLDYLVPIQHFISIIIPNYFGNASTYNFWGKTDYIETVVAIGSIPCLFVYFAFRYKLQTHLEYFTRNLFAVTTFLTILLTLDTPFTHLLLSLSIPFFSTDPPSRIFLLTSFSLAIIGGIGFETVLNHRDSVIKLYKHVFPFCLFLLIILLITYVLSITGVYCPIRCSNTAIRNTLLEYSFFILCIVLLSAAFIVNDKFKSLTFWLICFLVFASGLYNAEKYLPFSPKNSLFPQWELFSELSNLPAQGRIFGFNEASITTNLATYYHFYDPEYYHPLYIKRYGELTAFANTGIYGKEVLRGDALINNHVSLSPTAQFRRERLFSLLGVSYLIYNQNEMKHTASSTVIWRDNLNEITKNDSALPKVYAVTDIKLYSNPDKILNELFSRNFDDTKSVVLEDNTFPSLAGNLLSEISIKEYKENNIVINSKTNLPSVLVLNDNYYPGWNAYIDGQQTKIYRANYTFKAIFLPAGLHKISFIYEPISVKIGIFISLLTVIFLAVLYVYFSYFYRERK